MFEILLHVLVSVIKSAKLNNCTSIKCAVNSIAITFENKALKITIIDISAGMAFRKVFLLILLLRKNTYGNAF